MPPGRPVIDPALPSRAVARGLRAGFAGRFVTRGIVLAPGAVLRLLGAGRHGMRNLVLRGLPAPLAARLPHPIGAR